MDGRFRWLRVEPTDVWPGLTRLWYGGLLSGLLVAVAFSIVLNATLLVGLAWPAMVPSAVKGALLAITVAMWGVGWIDALRVRHHDQLRRQRDPQLDLFLSARGEYLKRNWSSAEELLQRLLRETPEDVEARLMLATLLRQVRRLADAKEQLRRLQRWSRAAVWNLEIRQEWEQLSKLECSAEWTANQAIDERVPSVGQQAGNEAA